MAIDTLSFAKTLEGIMRVFKNMFQAKKDLAVAEETLAEATEVMTEVMQDATICLNHATKLCRILMKEHDALLDAFAAERAQKERYRTAFLDRMNVPVIGKAWTGDDGYSEES
jgi:hypothetical protein